MPTASGAAVVALPELFHHRWALPLLAELQRSGGGRFVTLAYRLGAGQGALRMALDFLIELGLVTRNPGHGHPLRPEYLLTPAGQLAAPACGTLMVTLQRQDLVEVGLRKWTLPVLHALGSAPARYSDIREHLPGITDRALAGALRILQESGLLRRRLMDSYPPVAEYSPSPRGARLRHVLVGLAESLARAA